MKRRSFLQTTALTGAGLATGLGLSGFATATEKLVILHTNDVHSYIEPFAADHPKYANLGGVSRRAAAIEKIRQTENHVLLLDAGDIFQGTPYFNFYGGKLELKLMSMMGYDAATFGNHEFDNGLEGLLDVLPEAQFPFVTTNYDFSNTILAGRTKPYLTLKKGPWKIGILGLGVKLEGLVDTAMYKETRYIDPLEVTQETVNHLRNTEKCDLVICLSHLGYAYANSTQISDLVLAEKTYGIDVIIGGHTHTFLKEPTRKNNAQGNEVLVTQTGCYGVNLGRIDLELTSGSVTKQNSGLIQL